MFLVGVYFEKARLTFVIPNIYLVQTQKQPRQTVIRIKKVLRL